MLEGDRWPCRTLKLGTKFVCGFADELDTFVVSVPGGVVEVVPRPDGREPLADGLASIRTGKGGSESGEESSRSWHAIFFADVPVVTELGEAEDTSPVGGFRAVCEGHEGDLVSPVS